MLRCDESPCDIWEGRVWGAGCSPCLFPQQRPERQQLLPTSRILVFLSQHVPIYCIERSWRVWLRLPPCTWKENMFYLLWWQWTYSYLSTSAVWKCLFFGGRKDCMQAKHRKEELRWKALSKAWLKVFQWFPNSLSKPVSGQTINSRAPVFRKSTAWRKETDFVKKRLRGVPVGGCIANDCVPIQEVSVQKRYIFMGLASEHSVDACLFQSKYVISKTFGTSFACNICCAIARDILSPATRSFTLFGQNRFLVGASCSFPHQRTCFIGVSISRISTFGPKITFFEHLCLFRTGGCSVWTILQWACLAFVHCSGRPGESAVAHFGSHARNTPNW